jgi:hypothetical protein
MQTGSEEGNKGEIRPSLKKGARLEAQIDDERIRN